MVKGYAELATLWLNSVAMRESLLAAYRGVLIEAEQTKEAVAKGMPNANEALMLAQQEQAAGLESDYYMAHKIYEQVSKDMLSKIEEQDNRHALLTNMMDGTPPEK